VDVDLVATVLSDDALVAPLSHERAAAVHIEGLRGEEVVGIAVLGDLLELRAGPETFRVMARRAHYVFVSRFDQVFPPPKPMPPELVPLLQLGATSFRERLICAGDAFRVRGHSAALRLDELLDFSV
jgi:hypothetical protein